MGYVYGVDPTYRADERYTEANAVEGSQLVCTTPGRSGEYFLTKGKVYTALDVAAPLATDLPFTFPAYVTVLDDRGKRAMCHLSRFQLSQT